MSPRSPVQAGESKKDRARRKYSIIKSNKRRESTVRDKAHLAVLERVRIQRISIQAAGFPRAHHATLERAHIQINSIQTAESSRAHHVALEHVHIQH